MNHVNECGWNEYGCSIRERSSSFHFAVKMNYINTKHNILVWIKTGTETRPPPNWCVVFKMWQKHNLVRLHKHNYIVQMRLKRIICKHWNFSLSKHVANTFCLKCSVFTYLQYVEINEFHARRKNKWKCKIRKSMNFKLEKSNGNSIIF